MWYVVQVIKGREEAMAALIERVVPRDILEECFAPRYATERKVRGVWEPCERDLFPGYIIAITDDPAALERALVQLPEFARVISMGETFVPLSEEEVDLIGGFTKRGSRTVPMSRAVKEGERVMVVSGPLVGHEGLIREINRRKSLAFLEIDLCGRTVGVRMGLGVVSAPDSMESRRAALYHREARASA